MGAATPLDLRLGLTDAADVAHPLRWGIIGTGSISAQWVASLAPCAGARVTAVAARDQARAQRFADQHGIGTVCASYAELVALPEVDIVYVGTINRLHREHTLLALAAGKHVLCEKPLAETAADARAMYAAADARGVMLQDGMWTRYFPAVEHARSLIEEGAIGEVVLVQSDFFDPIYAIQAVPLGFGGAARPTAIAVAGRNASAAVVGVRRRPLRGTHLSAASLRSRQRPRRLVGSRGRITLHRPAHCPTRLTLRVPEEGGVPSLYQTNNVPAPAHELEYPLPGGGEPRDLISEPARLPVSGRGDPPLPGRRATRVPAVRPRGVAARHGPADRHQQREAGGARRHLTPPGAARRRQAERPTVPAVR